MEVENNHELAKNVAWNGVFGFVQTVAAKKIAQTQWLLFRHGTILGDCSASILHGISQTSCRITEYHISVSIKHGYLVPMLKRTLAALVIQDDSVVGLLL